VPPEERFVCRFAAEPSQDPLPYGRRADALREAFLGEVGDLDTEGEDLGDVGELLWHPDRTWNGRTYAPVTGRTTNGFEVLGYVSWPTGEPEALQAVADFTDVLAEDHPDWRLDVSDEVIGAWRGPPGHQAAMTLVWGVPLVDGGVIATAELAGLVVDQCPLEDGRFTLVAPDDFRQDTLEVRLWSAKGAELAHESLDDED
jgi:hypothetical protein